MKSALLLLVPLLLGGSSLVGAVLDSSLFTGCGNTSTCFLVVPSNCAGGCSGPDCDLVAIIEDIPSQSKFRIQLHSDRDYSYMAIGFSLDRLMGFSDVVGCDKSDASTANAKDTYNIAGRFNVIGNNQSGISNFTANISGNNFSCTFDRTYLSPPGARGYSLNSGSYFLFLATRVNGFITAANQGFAMHSDTPCISGSPVNLLQPSPVVSTGRDFNPVIVHGLLMVFAWQVLIVIGIFMASYTKFIFPNGEWFQVHKYVNLFAILVACIGFILIFVTVQGWSTGSNYVLAHQIFGISAMLLMFLNPILAVFRCRPKAKYRWIFNTLHGGVGLAASTFASVAMELGFQIYYEFRLPVEETSSRLARSVGLWIFSIWGITLCFFYVPLIVYRIWKTKAIKEENKSMEKDELPYENPFNIILHNIIGYPCCPPKDMRKDPAKEWPIIVGVLISFIIYNLVFYLACVIALALS